MGRKTEREIPKAQRVKESRAWHPGVGKDLKKRLSLIPGNTDGFQDSQALQGSLIGETMVAAATLGSGSRRAGKELAIPKPTPQCQGQTRRMEQKRAGCGCSVVGEHKKQVCLKWSLLLRGVGKQKSSHRGSILIKLAGLNGFPARLVLLLLVRTSPMDEN